jgi:hypothetical protein
VSESAPPDERLWERGWDAHQLAQRRRLARLPLAAKLEWLEEAQKLIERLRRGPRREGAPRPRRG